MYESLNHVILLTFLVKIIVQCILCSLGLVLASNKSTFSGCRIQIKWLSTRTHATR